MTKTKLAFQPGTFQIKLGADKLEKIYQRSEIFFCNKEEAQKILNTEENSIEELVKRIHNWGPKKVVITNGKNGLSAFDGEKMHSIPAFPDKKKMIDLTGAGDATSATIVAMLSLGMRFDQALKYGTINAMSVISEVGAQKGLLTRDQIERYL